MSFLDRFLGRKSASSEHSGQTSAMPIGVSVVGPLQKNSDGSWVINPKSTYPLTIAGVGESEVEWLKQSLDHLCEEFGQREMQEIGYFLLGTRFVWKELIEYVATYKPVYDSALERHKEFSPGWSTASPEKKEGLLPELAEKAWGNVPLRLVEDFDLSIDPGLAMDTLQRYGKWPLAEYIVGIQSKTGTRTAKKQRWVRMRMEQLVEVGLADQIKEGVFRMKPVPEDLEDLDITVFEKAERNALAIAGLLYSTYSAGYANRKHLNSTLEAGYDTWMLMNDDPCPVCRTALGKKKVFSRSELIRLPVHLGCRCGFLAVPESMSTGP